MNMDYGCPIIRCSMFRLCQVAGHCLWPSWFVAVIVEPSCHFRDYKVLRGFI